jgi:uncharacterized membrane protein YkvA (DUF1232 family)
MIDPSAVLGPLLVFVTSVIAMWLALVGVVWLHRPTRDLALPLLRLLPDVVRLVRRLLADPTTPRPVRIALAGMLLWFVSPIDLIPELIPVVGALDDIVLAVLVLRWSARRLGRERLRTAWPGTDEGFALLERVL